VLSDVAPVYKHNDTVMRHWDLITTAYWFHFDRHLWKEMLAYRISNKQKCLGKYFVQFNKLILLLIGTVARSCKHPCGNMINKKPVFIYICEILVTRCILLHTSDYVYAYIIIDMFFVCSYFVHDCHVVFMFNVKMCCKRLRYHVVNGV
jgi:hypothetical protein